ncbi:luciferase [Pseudoclavibacter endophyticus]|uniref:LLM class flavin-dependent oxidoreductase n=1 Tax=Pseudoclavibacter endophyticus TaxID=1778590 RepID=A0A6H9WPG9_9MICO|nr:LLM class flavin-dependent oxidoreductase [Pseudoclavibacter endophyticus]KAB1648917.1 LLM class flavin-dependent oxidoreductase [Pseudoclavibacter endophyticus]GGA67261.1 luciferase [Pseudoclavibacter endophyticus]
MHIGVNFGFGRADTSVSEHDIVKNETGLAVLSEELGFDSVWAVEHHFTDYSFCPDNLQWLAYVGAKTVRIKLGTGGVILPWNDPLRVAEKLMLLDNLTEGRVIFGMGRGLARSEFEGMRIPVGESRERFDEMLPMIIQGLETGHMEGAGPHYVQPRVQIKPGPYASFAGRMYTVAGSEESMVAAVKNRISVMSFLVRPVDKLVDTFNLFNDKWRATWDDEPAPVCLNVNMYCHPDPEVAKERMYKHVGAFWQQNVDHYEFTGTHFATQKGYERYDEKAKFFRERGVEQAGRDYADAAIGGTPEQILEKLDWIQSILGRYELVVAPAFGGMPYDQAEASLRLFAEEVAPKARIAYDARVAEKKLASSGASA